MLDAYFSYETQSWVRLEKQEDGEYCHTSGFPTRIHAILGTYKVYSEPPLPDFLIVPGEDHGT